MNYAFWKINLCFRALILDYMGLIIDKELNKQIIGEIEKFKIKHKIRL